ncbi:hypothetical protein C3729_00705 [Cloacibacterium normanense]|uniref:Uncharacterized protein n=1 Tax=Cloacibacterium normanense TaxID=237258 RepID=A0A2S7I7R2_9FLAO|nr:hypothetical protein C3729_00705 [Cloacibacterium normanense]
MYSYLKIDYLYNLVFLKVYQTYIHKLFLFLFLILFYLMQNSNLSKNLVWKLIYYHRIYIQL